MKRLKGLGVLALLMCVAAAAYGLTPSLTPASPRVQVLEDDLAATLTGGSCPYYFLPPNTYQKYCGGSCIIGSCPTIFVNLGTSNNGNYKGSKSCGSCLRCGSYPYLPVACTS
jgi:hypothetical protein